MERLKHMKETLMGCVEGQLGDLQGTDTEELGQAIDMIKDLEEAMYYCSIVKAMEESEKEKQMPRYYGSRYMPPEVYYPPYERDMDRDMGRMYYSERQPRNEDGEFISRRRGYYGGESGGSNSGSGNGSGRGGMMSDYTEREMHLNLRDEREGRSPMRRRNYMESKELHKDKASKMQELEDYMKDLSEDIVEMIQGTSPEEKQMLEKKLTQLTSKISQLSV